MVFGCELRIGNCQIGIKSDQCSIPNSQFSSEDSAHTNGLAIAQLRFNVRKNRPIRPTRKPADRLCIAHHRAGWPPPQNFRARHIANQILRSGTAGAANYGEARGAESRADFIHKMRIVQKELNETNVWLRIILRSSLLPPELVVDIIAENKELARIASASIKTARTHGAVSDEN